MDNAFNIRNGPKIKGLAPELLAIGSEVLVWKKKEGWKGPYKILSVTDSNVTVDMVNGPMVFRNTVCKPYYKVKNEKQKTYDKDQKLLFKYPLPNITKPCGKPKKNLLAKPNSN